MEHQTDHDRVMTSGGWYGVLIGAAVLGIIDAHLPLMLGWTVNTLVVLGIAYAMAVWKRCWYGWLAFWGLVAMCAIDGGLDLFVQSWPYGNPLSIGIQAWAQVFIWIWYWLIRMPRRQTEAPPQVSHVIHHHVIDGLPAHVQTAEQVIEDRAPRVIEGSVSRKAIGAAPVQPNPAARLVGATWSRIRQGM
jgi:hypothetical protein